MLQTLGLSEALHLSDVLILSTGTGCLFGSHEELAILNWHSPRDGKAICSFLFPCSFGLWPQRAPKRTRTISEARQGQQTYIRAVALVSAKVDPPLPQHRLHHVEAHELSPSGFVVRACYSIAYR